jgi:hypothetical protein
MVVSCAIKYRNNETASIKFKGVSSRNKSVMISGKRSIPAYAIFKRISGDNDTADPEDNPKSTARI